MILTGGAVWRLGWSRGGLPIHSAQLLTYLKLTGHTVGLLLNFNTVLLRHGMRRILNG